MLKRVLALLRDEYMLEEKDLKIKQILYPDVELEDDIIDELHIKIRLERTGSTICEWKEAEKQEETVYFEGDGEEVMSSRDIVCCIKGELDECPSLQKFYRERCRKLAAKNKKLKERNKRLEKKYSELERSLGGKKSLKTEKRFEKLC
ncbi:hypothetical protein A9K97_gp443 [Tokyovirus A1]|uniref:hypothetical protein n=1 Tax=Tokyovirus A1 TaxID=1826170 RepID=UPI0007A97874|nr:hypothetical protein A9K97_gp443 [Tokyovirus A1]BAU79908.1 hypothetical protein [Tokyovirus A1]